MHSSAQIVQMQNPITTALRIGWFALLSLFRGNIFVELWFPWMIKRFISASNEYSFSSDLTRRQNDQPLTGLFFLTSMANVEIDAITRCFSFVGFNQNSCHNSRNYDMRVFISIHLLLRLLRALFKHNVCHFVIANVSFRVICKHDQHHHANRARCFLFRILITCRWKIDIKT